MAVISTNRHHRVHRRPFQWFPYLLVAPLLLWIAGTVAYPLLTAVGLSFTNTGVVGTDGSFVGLANYKKVLLSGPFWASAWISLKWVLLNGVLQTGLALASAVLLSRGFRGHKAARTWLIAPWVIPTAAVAVIWGWMLSGTLGVVNYLLTAVHLIEKPLNFLGMTSTALPTAAFINTWHWFPFMAVVLLAGIQGIPAEIYEASAVDGANGMQQFIHITLPSLRPVVSAMGLVGTLWSFNVFDIVYLLTKGGPSGATRTLPVYIYEKGFKAFAIGEAAAASVVTALFLLTFALWYLRSESRQAPSERRDTA